MTKKKNDEQARSTAGKYTPVSVFDDLTAADRKDLGNLNDVFTKRSVEQLDGQETLPGFEEKEERPTPLDADTIKKNIGKASFNIDFLVSPEDALAKHNAPAGLLSKYLKAHFDNIVKIAAEITGADPEQLADKDRRTPEQQKLLNEVAGSLETKRLDYFFASLYMRAMETIHDEKSRYWELHTAEPGESKDEYEERVDDDYITPVMLHSVLYFFALHKEISPIKPGDLTEQEQQELKDIFHRIDDFYCDYEIETEEPLPDVLNDLFRQFIEKEHPAKGDAEKILAELPRLQSINPTAHIMPNNALMNAMQTQGIIEDPDTAQGWDILVSAAKGKRKEITSYVMVTYDPEETGVSVTGANLTEYERQVSDSVASIWIDSAKNGIPCLFTSDMVHREMPGRSDKASPQQKGAITRTLEKFRRMHITIDATEEMRKRGLIEPNATYKLDNFYLSATHAEYKVKNGGQTVNGYKLESEPIILTYAKMTNQLLTVPSKYLAIEKVKKLPVKGELIASGEPLMMNADRQAMTGYLLRRIAVMKNDLKRAKEELNSYNKRRKKDSTLEEKSLDDFRQQSNTILFSTIFSETDTTTDNRKQTMLNRNFCLEVLDFWKVKGFIKGYALQTKGRNITGIIIDI